MSRTRTYKKFINEVKTPDYWKETSATEATANEAAPTPATKKKKKTSNKQRKRQRRIARENIS